MEEGRMCIPTLESAASFPGFGRKTHLKLWRKTFNLAGSGKEGRRWFGFGCSGNGSHGDLSNTDLGPELALSGRGLHLRAVGQLGLVILTCVQSAAPIWLHFSLRQVFILDPNPSPRLEPGR